VFLSFTKKNNWTKLLTIGSRPARRSPEGLQNEEIVGELIFFFNANRVTRLGEISPFGRFIMVLGKFFSRKNSPMIWAKF